MSQQPFKHTCKCTNCGNEAEMVVTCTLEGELPENATPGEMPAQEGQTKAHAVCSHCGGEADIWLDLRTRVP